MDQEADKDYNKKVEAKNAFEKYVYDMRTMIRDEIGDKLTADDKKKLEDSVEAAIEWLEGNQLAEVDEFEDKQKELDSICNPILAKLYPGGVAGGAIGMGSDFQSSAGNEGPTMEDIE